MEYRTFHNCLICCVEKTWYTQFKSWVLYVANLYCGIGLLYSNCSTESRLSRLALWSLLRQFAKLYGAQIITMKKEISGQPYLLVKQKNNSFRLSCSIAHSADVGVAAIAIDEAIQVGIDVEQVRVFSDELLSQFMTDDELKYLATVPEELKMITATKIWSLKEAYLKLYGVGLKRHPNTVNTLCFLLNESERYHSFGWVLDNQKMVTVIAK